MALPFLSLLLALALGSVINAEEGRDIPNLINETSLEEADEDYDFLGVVGLSLNDTVLFFNDKGGEDLPLEEAATTILLTQIETLKSTTMDKEKRIQQLVAEKASMAEEWQIKMEEIQRQKNLEKAKYEKDLTNKKVLIRFLSYRLRNHEKKARISKDVIKAQNEKLHVLGRERKTYQEKNKMFLRQAYLQADEIMRQEKQKTALKEALKSEVTLQQDYCNLTDLLQNNPIENFPSYVTLLTKTLTDQTEELNKLR